MTGYWYEVYLGAASLTADSWQEFCQKVSRNLGWWRTWRIIVHFDRNIVHYYLESPKALPASLYLQNFLIKPTTAVELPAARWRGTALWRSQESLADLRVRLSSKGKQLEYLILDCGFISGQLLSRAAIITAGGAKEPHYAIKTLLAPPATLLAIDFKRSHNLTYKKFPKYLGIEKVAPYLTPAADQAWLVPEAFPYLETSQFLELERIDFAKHSLILGGSGTGKSKFIAGFIRQVYQTAPEDYQIVVIDPHAALEADLCDIPTRTVVNFATALESIDLFSSPIKNLNVSVELMLALFKGLLDQTYNSRLERVLRFSTYLLMNRAEFGFASLRRLLLELEYRTELVQTTTGQVPTNVTQFFLTDFQEIKNQYYSEAIAPIIAFIDELQMVPVFSEESQNAGLDRLLPSAFLHIFSLDRLKLGEKVVQTIAGLLFQQLFLVAEQRDPAKHLIIIIDEVAVIENPILARFLAELRKYRVSVMLAGQYFDQMSSQLRAAILANTTNFYLFRVSKADATLLAQNLDIKPANSDQPEDQPKLLTSLKLRELLVKTDIAGEPLPTFKARTLDYQLGIPVPALTLPPKANSTAVNKSLLASFDFELEEPELPVVPFIITSRKKLI